MARRSYLHGEGTSVRCRNPRTGKSLSITVYSHDLVAVAREVETALRRRWTTTSLADKRHQRRHD